MQSKPTERAIGPMDCATSGQPPRPEARIRPDHATLRGRSTPRRGAAKAPGVVSMDYQQGFFSGPSS
ncbi:hypothetical protein [Roseicyclus mahoneyensis]|uniref:Uncharacterized protein n=1 Tax=Roseicyclus mahoneyensis TaxID=164332 RepID=A0A316GN51_9RHOB|nr:hypothetical protein [Roseicyclus mahoneyensis]PWK60863.1 hypothetical protein C7455_10361 [Roseicyclus mahoneyensis]